MLVLNKKTEGRETQLILTIFNNRGKKEKEKKK